MIFVAALFVATFAAGLLVGLAWGVSLHDLRCHGAKRSTWAEARWPW